MFKYSFFFIFNTDVDDKYRLCLKIAAYDQNLTRNSLYGTRRTLLGYRCKRLAIWWRRWRRRLRQLFIDCTCKVAFRGRRMID